MPFSALQCEEMFAERPFCLFTPGVVFLEHCQKFPRFSNFTFLFRKTENFGLFVLFLMENGKTRKMVNLQNGI